MGIGQTLLIYGVVGLVVTAALTVQVGSENLSAAAPKWLMWCLCWPFFAPGLLSGRSEAEHQPFTEPGQGLEAAEARLVESLRALESQVPSALLERHVARVRTLSAGLERLQGRQGEIQRMLSTPEFDGTRATRALAALRERGLESSDPRVLSVEGRLRNIERLRAMAAESGDSLERARLEMEQMHSQVGLLRFSDDVEGALGELLTDLVESVGHLTAGLEASP